MAEEPEFKLDGSVTERDLLFRIYRELRTIRENTGKALFAIHDAESEIPEKMRRFIMYMHDVHDIVNLYQEHGQEAPEHVKHEMRRCDDRYRQLLNDMHSDVGVFEKVRQTMAADPNNRWDHTRQLAKPKEKSE